MIGANLDGRIKTATFGWLASPCSADPHLPEVTVQIVEATRSPALGSAFMVFHAPLTDVSYTLTITESLKGTSRTYSNIAGGSGQLCGAVDSSGFLP